MINAFELEPGEQIIIKTRKHWFIFLIGLLPYAILAILPIALPNLLTLSDVFAPFAERLESSGPLLRTVRGVWWLLVWTGAWGNFTRYYLNVWILTSQRIVEVKQHAYFHREVSSVLLNRVQDVTSEVHGVISSLLHIGSIAVQSAGAQNEFHMRGIPEPEAMRDLILRYVPEESPATGI